MQVNVVGNRENAGYQRFLLFPQCCFSPKGIPAECRKVRNFSVKKFRLTYTPLYRASWTHIIGLEGKNRATTRIVVDNT